MAINLGYVPIPLTVTLVTDGDFLSTLVASTPWPAGTMIQLRFATTADTPTVWAATVAGTNAAWDVPAATVNTLLGLQPGQVVLRYAEADGTSIVWGKGTVHAH